MSINDNPIDLMMHLTLNGEGDIDEHIMTLFSVCLSMKPSLILELGVRSGRSTLPFLFASSIVDSKVVSVDIEKIRPDFNFPDFWKSRQDFYEKDAIKFLKEDLESILRDTDRDGRPRIFYIDDWHSYEHVKEEVSLISKHATPSDLILLHDLMYYNSQPQYRSVDNPKDKQWGNGGPHRAINELDLEDWEFSTIPRCNGMTFLRKKDSILSEDHV